MCRVLAVLREPHALVLARVAGQPLAAKPNLQSLLRCRWPPGCFFAPGSVARMAHCVASALAYLHGHCICHGDVYAHNILADAHGRATLLDYGGRPPALRLSCSERRKTARRVLGTIMADRGRISGGSVDSMNAYGLDGCHITRSSSVR